MWYANGAFVLFKSSALVATGGQYKREKKPSKNFLTSKKPKTMRQWVCGKYYLHHLYIWQFVFLFFSSSAYVWVCVCVQCSCNMLRHHFRGRKSAPQNRLYTMHRQVCFSLGGNKHHTATFRMHTYKRRNRTHCGSFVFLLSVNHRPTIRKSNNARQGVCRCAQGVRLRNKQCERELSQIK